MESKTRNQPEETRESGEVSEISEQKTMDDATLEPGTLIEKTVDFRQAESIQEAFTRVVENTAEQVRRQPETAKGPFEQVSGNGKDGGEEATQIPLPGPRRIASQEATLEAEAETNPRTTQRGCVAMDDNPPPPPDLGWMEPEGGGLYTDISETTLGTDLEFINNINTLQEASRNLRALSVDLKPDLSGTPQDEELLLYSQDLGEVAKQMGQLAGHWEKIFSATNVYQDNLIEVSGLGNDLQMLLQMLMEKSTQTERKISTIINKFENTQRDLVANLK